MANNFKGFPYPIQSGAQGFFGSPADDIEQIKSDLLILLLTNPGERVMLPEFGTPLNDLFFDPNDATLAARARQMIIDSITQWEPRIAVDQIAVTTTADRNMLSPDDDLTEMEGILTITIQFRDPGNVTEKHALKLEVPLPGGG